MVSTSGTTGDAAISVEERICKLQAENDNLRNELSDMQLMYDNMMEHGVAVEDQLADRNIDLERIQKRLAAELADAANYVQSILPAPSTKYPKTMWRFIPSSELGGDSFGYHWIDDDHFALYLLDVCGHGVGAALLSVTVINVLRAGALRSTDIHDPSEVLTGLNNAFDMTKQNDMFFTFWYGVYRCSTRTLRYASGGHPPAVLVTRTGDETIVKKLSMPQLAIGAMPGVTFKSSSCEVPLNSRLFVFSDGVFELRKQKDLVLDLDGLVKHLTGMHIGSSYTLDNLITDLRRIQGSETFEDDFSMMYADLI